MCWLIGSRQRVTDVAMESTGVFWKPIWNILESRFRLLLANAHELKQPGAADVKMPVDRASAGLRASDTELVPGAQRELRDPRVSSHPGR